jgi:tetratricopeptide (TPR) repeat protein
MLSNACMNRSIFVIPLVFLALLAGGALFAGQSENPPTVSPLEQQFRDGLYAEEAKQDLEAARKAYQAVVAAFDRDRETASSALFRLGEVHRKQNRPKDAAECFRRVVSEFPDREPLARLARENLQALGEPLPAAPGGTATVSDPEEDKALARLRQLEKDSPDLILKAGTDLKSTGFLSYDEGAQAGYVRVVQWYLDHGASPDATPSGNCPLTIAASFGHVPLVSFLLEKGANISGTKDHEYPLRAAAEKGHLTTLVSLARSR